MSGVTAGGSIANGETRMQAMEANGTAYNLANAVQYVTPTTGQTVVANGSGLLAVNPAGLLAALTITFPSSPVDGQSFEVASTQIVTALTMNGGTIKNALTALAVNGWARWRYVASGSAWYSAS